MATLLLSAAGASLGAGFGGTILGLSGAVIGRAVGATVGRVIDQRLLGGGSRAVETGRIDRLRLQTAGEGRPIPRVWGQVRLPGHVIWASPLTEVRRTQGHGKGSPQPKVTEISYMISVALALCEGEILGVGRIWADGEELSHDDLNMQVYPGSDTQLPDPVIAAEEGAAAPAYRGTAYVVLENLGLERWGNRVPQLHFEVTRAAQDGTGLCRDVRAVAMIPGTGEYSLATTPITFDLGLGETKAVNTTTAMAATDLQASLATMSRELPAVESVSLVVSWFGDDLRAQDCTIRPKIELKGQDGSEMTWRAGGIGRAEAHEVARRDGRPIYGGTPSDQSVVQALAAISKAGKKAMFYPFILMEQTEGNGLSDPYGASEQAVMPWRGRVTTRVAAGRPGTTDSTSAAVEEVAAFFGNAGVNDFSVSGTDVRYTGPDEWAYRRFILHYAHLCAAAGGVEAFLIGSEMVALTQIRDAGGEYPAVEQFRRLARDCRAILGPKVKISYAADWSEYFGHHPASGDLRFHLDPLWADDAVDFIGIDNYMPLSDWRDSDHHLDAAWGQIDHPKYLLANVAGGEGFDWYYASESDRAAQRRTPITDGAHGEPWVWRYKDIRSWWENTHHERIDGVRQDRPTAWVPSSKPVWFTEYGCAALDKATNQPNKFLDAMSSESALPYFSDGRRDDNIQAAYITAVNAYWLDAENNPPCPTGGRMVDLTRAHVWCWDARPFPAFPSRTDLWSDGPAWERGHWLNGRAGAVRLGAVVRDICREAGVVHVDTTRLSGVVRGFALAGGESARSALQPLMLTHGFDAVETEGTIRFVMRGRAPAARITADHLAVGEDLSGVEFTRSPDVEIAGRVRLSHVEAGGDYAVTTAETMLPDGDTSAVAETEFPLTLTRGEGKAVAERWLAESMVARDAARFVLPPSFGALSPTDVVSLQSADGRENLWRIDRIERAGALTIDAVRVDRGVYRPADPVSEMMPTYGFQPALPVWPLLMDLPLIAGDEAPHAPYLAVTATPWRGAVASYISAQEIGGFQLDQTILRRAIMGITLTPLAAARPGVLDRSGPLVVRLKGGHLEAQSLAAVLSGANLMAIGDGTAHRWELFQFTTARLTDTGDWEISGRLRGQAGTDGIMPDVWPKGSIVVLMDSAPRQSMLPPSARGQMRYWRIGSALRSPHDPSFRSLAAEVKGIGLRPYAPCHLRRVGNRLTWVRRTRFDGDGWDGIDVPLNEAREAYVVRLIVPGQPARETVTDRPFLDLPADLAAGGRFTATVAQLSDQFGAGPQVRRDF